MRVSDKELEAFETILKTNVNLEKQTVLALIKDLRESREVLVEAMKTMQYQDTVIVKLQQLHEAALSRSKS